MPHVLRPFRSRLTPILMGATAIGLFGTLTPAQDRTVCQLIDGALPAGCTQPNAGLTVAVPVGEQPSEIVAPPANASGGFSVRINGREVVGDTGVENAARRVDVALAEADVQVVFDGLGAAPRLDLEVVGPAKSYDAGERVTLQSAMNYPSYVTRGEVRFIDLTTGRTLAVIPISPNGQTAMTVPEGENVGAVHRVYDANGRFDETYPVPLGEPDTRVRADGVEDGANTMAQSRIPVYGGAITVSGSNVVSGATVRALGETVRPDASGGFVIQRIVPSGTHDVDVGISGAGQQALAETRRVEVPTSEWFYAGIADLTFGAKRDRGSNTWNSFNSGRFAVYVDGRTDTGVQITGSLDTGEGPLNEIFRELDEKDPASVLHRLDPNDLYPTYGDDSTIVDNTPTDGKIYLRVEQAGNYALWGNFDANLGGNSYVRTDRTLYGFQGHYATQDTRTNGEAVASLDVYAAQPDRLPQRDGFRGTGGSVYFLEQQDIAIGTETLTVQLRDPVSDRVIGARTLTAGVDYSINYVQGIVTLARPLQSSTVSNGVVRDIRNDAEVQLIAQYEYTPTATSVDAFSYGARGEVWATDTLRFGLSGLVERNGIDEQTLVGADLRLQLSDNSWVQLDYAKSDGPGFGQTYSADGGLIVETQNPVAGSGTAIKVEGQADFADIGLGADGQISGYFERRTQGFSTLDVTVGASTGDERLWGMAVAAKASDSLSYSAAVDVYENDAGIRENTGELAVAYAVNDRIDVEVGLSTLDRANATETGKRTDVGARLTYGFADNATVYAYGQASVVAEGLDRNNRFGIGATYAWNNGWSVEADVSGGNQGTAARALARYEDGIGNSYYAGYELEAGRELSGVTREGRDLGQVVVGGQRVVSDQVSVFGENTYDAFGRHRTLTSAYGLSYNPNDATRYSVAFETGTVKDGQNYDFERYAVSVGATHQTDALSVSGRFEYRTDDGRLGGSNVAAQTFLLNTDLAYKFNDESRVVASLDYARTDTDQGSLLDGEFGEVVLGYAFRPVMDDKLNVLARYRYLHDMFGQRVDGVDENGPRQRSHVLSVNAIYDLDPNWSVAGKIGYRASETSPDETSPFAQNDAYLISGALTYHLVHEWDAMVEVRNFSTVQAGTSETGVIAAGYRHIGNNWKIGVGYNFGTFSDDLTDLVQDDEGAFINIVAKF
jgi:hypothetical protein